MTKKLLELEDMAFTVDRSRMIQTLKRSRLADKYAYVRDLLASAYERKATQINIVAVPGKIVIRDDGQGLAAETLDEKLATIFTDDEMDELTAGILSSFDCDVEEVRIESVPESGEPYQRSIYYQDGDINAEEPETLQNVLTKGTRITLRKSSKFAADSAKVNKSRWQAIKNTFTTAGVPEISRIRHAARDTSLTVKLNLFTIPKSVVKYPCLVSVPLNYPDVTGSVGLLQYHGIIGRNNNNTLRMSHGAMQVYRKGFFHGSYQYGDNPESYGYGPVSVEANYNKLKVDIAGKRLFDHQQMDPIFRVVNAAMNRLYHALLAAPESDARQQHLLLYTALYLPKIIDEGLNEEGSARHFSIHGFNNRSPDQELVDDRELYKKVRKELLFPTKDHGMVSLERLVKELNSGRKFFVDYRGFNYDKVPAGAIVLRPDEHNVMNVIAFQLGAIALTREGKFAERFIYARRQSPDAKQREQERENIKKTLKLPILYRPAEVLKNWYDFSFIPKTDFNTQKSKVHIMEGLFIGCFLTPYFVPYLVGSTGYGTLETIVLGAKKAAGIAFPYAYAGGQRAVQYTLPVLRPVAAYLAERYHRHAQPRLTQGINKSKQLLLTAGTTSFDGGKTVALACAQKARTGIRAVGYGIGVSAGVVAGTAITVGGIALAGATTAIAGLATGGYLTWKGTTYLTRQGRAGATYAFHCSKLGAMAAGKTLNAGLEQLAEYYGQKFSPRVQRFIVRRRSLRKQKALLSASIAEGQRSLKEETATARKLSDTYAQEEHALRRFIKEHIRTSTLYWNRFEKIMDNLIRKAVFEYCSIKYVHLSSSKGEIEFPGAIMRDTTKSYYSTESYYSLAHPLKILCNRDDTSIRKLVKIVGSTNGEGNIPTYLGSLLIDEANIGTAPMPEKKSPIGSTQATMIRFHQEIMQERREQWYETMVNAYHIGNKKGFMTPYHNLDRAAKVDVLTKVLKLERQTELDILLEADEENIPLLDEAGRRVLQEEEKTHLGKVVDTPIRAESIVEAYRISTNPLT